MQEKLFVVLSWMLADAEHTTIGNYNMINNSYSMTLHIYVVTMRITSNMRVVMWQMMRLASEIPSIATPANL